MDCSCAPILRFFSVASDGATTERQIYSRVFGQFRTILRKDSVANYASIWTLFFSVCYGTRCTLQRAEHFAVPSVGGATSVANLWYKIFRNVEIRSHSCAKYFVYLLFTI